MPVPETAMNQNNSAVVRENNIGFPRKIAGVETEAEAAAVQQAADAYFRFCIGATNAAHHAAARGLVHNVSHGNQPGRYFWRVSSCSFNTLINASGSRGGSSRCTAE